MYWKILRTSTKNNVNDREIKQLEECLYNITGVVILDNHTAFKVKANEYVLTLQFTDRNMWIDVKKQSW